MRNTVLDNNGHFCEILKKYESFTVEEVINDGVIIKYSKNMTFSIMFFSDNYDHTGQMPLIVSNNFYEDFPHMITENMNINGTDYRVICLYEKDKYIFSNFNFEQKIDFILNQLEKLISLDKLNQEKEFQKEFSYYWNTQAQRNFSPHIYISCDENLKQLTYYKKNSKYRVLSMDKKLNDLSSWKKTKDVGFFIPIIDVSGILPPTYQRKWEIDDLLYILKNSQVDKIPGDVYNALSKLSIKSKKIDLFFRFPTEHDLIFGCRIIFKNSGVGLFFDKIIKDTDKIEPFVSKREDFLYLNRSIGNTKSDKKVAIVGCGSLGSYVSTELIKSGISNLVLVDGDQFTSENTFRHTLPHLFSDIKKSIALKVTLEEIHPEISVESYPYNLDNENIENIIKKHNIDIIIFCIGSTDEQIKLSKSLSGNKCSIIYSWLESNGQDSRIIGIPVNSYGCYRCLKKEVEILFPRSKGYEESIWISDGCGGTRVKYGNRTLLAASNGVLEAYEEILSSKAPFVIASNITKGIQKSPLEWKECDYCGRKAEEICSTE